MQRYIFITGGVVSSLGKAWRQPHSVRFCKRAGIPSVSVSSTLISTSIPER